MFRTTHSKGVEVTFYKIQMAVLTHAEPGYPSQCTDYKKGKGPDFEFREGLKKFLLQRPDQPRGFPGTYRIAAAPLSAGVKREKSGLSPALAPKLGMHGTMHPSIHTSS